ncbi:MAG: signal peptidase II [Anaerolineae bacterium]
MATTSPSTSHNTKGTSWLNTQIIWLRELPKALLTHQSILWAIAAIAIVIDQATKWWVEANIALHTRIVPIEGYGHIFDFLHVKNPGAAFGTGQELGWLFTTIAFVVCGFILFYNSVILGQHRSFRTALGFILGGALGNVIDRFRIGEVTDFIHFDFRPLASEWLVERVPLLNFAIFNFADLFIFSGVCIMFWIMWKDTLPDDPWTEEEPAKEEFEDWQRTQLAAEKPAINIPAADGSTSNYRNTQTRTHRQSFPDDQSELTESASNGQLGLKIALVLGVVGLIVAVVMFRKRRKQ